MDERSLKHLYDALMAARSIQRFADGKSYEDYRQDELLSSAIERKFEIIGECLIRVRREAPHDLKELSDWPAIIGFRNILAHGYDHVDDAVVWGIVQEQIPVLLKELEAVDEIEG
jgi:uncharacterized protein with HEPN domain